METKRIYEGVAVLLAGNFIALVTILYKFISWASSREARIAKMEMKVDLLFKDKKVVNQNQLNKP